ncbi:NAD(P)/FAD-dependent oxidoreductase [Wenxinia marina]|uniref:Glycine/D-amino acid oxidase (Deaminating) n=1 Tax=Wenxinia marina DSM 24838 TaxID=1123501 RepID=A0A0D0Q8U3_9RHOB|nr:FAD-binding oxidoreductase [Wenxinia marina]KIQ70824.1 Glycine/D-amino acid oxidase (deaminating) [Wenxinia marina DSM 24838]GGL57019.1 oxidoreductase [Wenxinia marina]
MRADVTIKGAGVFGLSVAWAALARGARVRVIDPWGPGAGASGGIVGALAPHVPEAWNEKKAFQLESLLMAKTFWADVEAASARSPGYARTGRLQPLADVEAVALARARAASAAHLWQGRAVWEVVDETAAGPFRPDSPTGLWVRDTLSARLHPRQAVAALAAAVRARGGEVVAAGPEEGAIVHATGAAGLAELVSAKGRPAGQGIKGQAALMRYDAPDAPQLFAGGVHVVPHADGTVAVGSTTEREWHDPAATDAQLDDVVAAARAAVPALRDAPVVERWAGLRPRARSRAPILGPWPGRPGHWIANGGFKIGFGMAPLAGEVLAAAILTGEDRIPEGFRPEASL